MVKKVGAARLDPVVLAELRRCGECKLAPVVFLTARLVPCCALHWGRLTEVGWSETE